MSKLIRLLRRAHAIEVGAYHAYEGHWRSVKPVSDPVRGKIKDIQIDELIHRENLFRMLSELNSKPSRAQDLILLLVGKLVSASCRILPRRLAAYGAYVMEILGDVCYAQLAQVARDEGYPAMAVELDYMQRTEQEHKSFMKALSK